MKVVFPVQGFCHTSKDVLPASCTSKPQISCTSAKDKVNQGLSNKEIYEGLVSVKDSLSSLFGIKKEAAYPLDYIA